MEDSIVSICPVCQTSLPLESNFCFKCGKKIKEPPISSSIPRQIAVYSLSFFLPPLGLWPAIKYLRQPDQKSKIIGVVCIALTVISTILTIWATLSFINTFNQTLQTQLGGTDLYLQIPGQN